MILAKKNCITLGHSPDADDAFMFYALSENKIETHGLKFEHILQDIQTLNERALRAELDITALSLHAYAFVSDKYALTTCGASIGDNYGPMIVATRPMSREELKETTIAIPGRMTTAFLLLSLFMGAKGDGCANPKPSLRDAKQSKIENLKSQYVHFNEIIPQMKAGRFEAGLIIHEGQLTYAKEGLHKVVDLGEWWKADTGGLPCPLGVNGVKKFLGYDMCRTLSEILKASIEYGLKHRAEGVKHAMKYGRDLTMQETDRFVGMYVNDFTLDMGEQGRKACQLMLDRAAESGLIPSKTEIEFV
jgi:1,4-dihydroxy-6-naphthoate synthase